jgi:nitrogen fixation NifU-like protein
VFSEAVLDHFQNPRNVGQLPDATASIEVTNPVCGDVLHLAARLKNSHIVEARFLCQGCTTAIACASLLTTELTNKSLVDARQITSKHLSQKLGTLPPATLHAAELASDALTALLSKLSAA